MRITKANFRLLMWVIYLQFISFALLAQTNVSVVTSKTGQVWMDRNLGASQVATSPTDSLALGVFYQWGRGTLGIAHLQMSRYDLLVLGFTVRALFLVL